MPKFQKGDVVYICGVINEIGYNPYVSGIVHHSFEGHWKGDTEYVIAVDVLDGSFECRSESTTWSTINGWREPFLHPGTNVG